MREPAAPGAPGGAPGGAPAGAPMERGEFLRWLMWGSLGLLSAQFTGVFLASFWPREITGFGVRVAAGRVGDFPPGSVTKIAEGRLYISHVAEGLLALYWRCPHLGCTVPWVAERKLFICPCHASTFLPNGVLISGPAPRPMDYMPVSVEDGTVFVDTGRVMQRQGFDPRQATPVPGGGG